MEKALFLNGVYDSVLDEIMKSQEKNPGRVFYLQPYSESMIKQLQEDPPTPKSPLPLYISTTTQLNQICYSAEIVGWEDKNEISEERMAMLNEQIELFQPNEGNIYPEVNGKKCVNLISIVNLKKLANQLSTSNLIKVSNEEPLKPRTRAGNWSYVYSLPLLLIEKTFIKDRLDEKLDQSVSTSSKDSSESRKKRLANAPKYPEKVQVISSGFIRNSDVIVDVLDRAKGKCELCGHDAPFYRASDGSPYLEVHHWITLAEGGEDTAQNAGALCPNCHKQAHFGKNKEFIKLNKNLPSL